METIWWFTNHYICTKTKQENMGIYRKTCYSKIFYTDIMVSSRTVITITGSCRTVHIYYIHYDYGD